MQCSWAFMLIRMNHLFRGVKSLPARQDYRIASYKFCFGRTCISITMKFINEIVNRGVTILSFFFFFISHVFLRKGNLLIFRGLKGAWKHIRTLEWKWKRDVTPVPLEIGRSLAQE